MTGVIASLIDGVLVGAVYGLAAMGLTLIWGVMNVINPARRHDRARHVHHDS
jgi:branched-subunit amino acid ABC-type transport system permease component